MGDVMVPTNNMTQAGMNATIMVATNGDPDGGLYNVCPEDETTYMKDED